MKTGMEYPLIGLVILVALVMLWNAWSGMQIELAAAATNAMAAGEAVPAPVTLAGTWLVKALVGAVIGGTVTAFVTVLIVWARRQWNAGQAPQNWKSGPYANWGRERGPKAPSEAEMMRMWMMQQMAQNGRPQPPVMRMQEGEDEPVIRF